MTNKLFDISDNVVLVSGGSRGIGYAIAKAFSNQGAQVIITGRDEKGLKKACEKSEKDSHNLNYQVCDVTDSKAINICTDAVVSEFGRIDTLINCAGTNNRKPALDYTPEEYDLIMDINLRGAFFMAQAVGRQMIRQKSGSQISIDSLSTYGSLAHVAPYGMSKSGLSSMTHALALEWGQHGVRVNAMAPGFILTDLNRELWTDPNLQAWNKTVTPLGRLGSVDDLIGTAIFLASNASSFLTGQVIRVDGGVSSGINWPINGGFEISLSV